MTTRVVSAHIPDALEQRASLEERRDQLTREGLVDLRAGRIVDHAAIEMWATTLTATKAVKRRK